MLVAYSRLTVRHDGIVIAAWGAHGAYMGRGDHVPDLLLGIPLHYLKLTRDGHRGTRSIRIVI